MAGSIEPARPRSFLGELELNTLTPERETDKPIFVGGITYNGGKNLLVIGDHNGKLLIGKSEAQTVDREFMNALRETGRIIRLDSFQTVNIRQVNLDAVEVQRSDSVYQHAPLSLSFRVYNPENEETERVSIAENDIFDIFTDQQGGIAVFSGKGFPEETGLIFSRGHEKEKEALILFMHPQDERSKSFNSVVGLEEFLRQINTELETDTDIVLQQQALQFLKQYEDKGTIDFGSKSVRREIFRLQVIAHARKNHALAVASLVPGVKRNLIGQPRKPSKDYPNRVNQTIDAIIVDVNRTSDTPEQNKKKGLTTERAKILKKNFDQTHNEGGKLDFMNEVYNWIDTITTIDEYSDIKYLLNHFFANIHLEFVTYNQGTKNEKLVHTKMYQTELEQKLLDRYQTIQQIQMRENIVANEDESYIFKTEKGQGLFNLYDEFPDDVYESDNDTARNFLIDVASWIANAGTAAEFDDIQYILDDFFESTYEDQYLAFSYKKRGKGRDKELTFNNEGQTRLGIALKLALREELDNKRSQNRV